MNSFIPNFSLILLIDRANGHCVFDLPSVIFNSIFDLLLYHVAVLVNRRVGVARSVDYIELQI